MDYISVSKGQFRPAKLGMEIISSNNTAQLNSKLIYGSISVDAEKAF